MENTKKKSCIGNTNQSTKSNENISIIDTNLIQTDKNEDNKVDKKTEPVVIKKKRGRKPKIKTEDEVPKEKKKRGRKPKPVSENDKKKELMHPRRRGRKPKDKFKYESTDFEEYQNIVHQDENIVIKLPLSCINNETSIFTNDAFPYNPILTEPSPFNPEDSYFANIKNDNNVSDIQDNSIDNNSINNNSINNNSIDNKNLLANKINDLKKENNFEIQDNEIQGYDNLNNYSSVLNNSMFEDNFNDKNTKFSNVDDTNNQNNKPYNTVDKEPRLRQIDIILNKKYNCSNDKIKLFDNYILNKEQREKKNNINCFWCTYSFEGSSWGIPLKYIDDMFHLFGVFCSPECTLGYILHNYDNDDYLWEIVSLLHLLYFKVYEKYENIIPAFDKIALKKYVGTLEIEEYRDIVNVQNKCYSLEFPPCNNIAPIMKEVYKKNNITGSFIPVDSTRIKKANNELKLKRNKPINNKNTLDNCMSIKI